MIPFDTMMQRTASPSPSAKPRQKRGFTLPEFQDVNNTTYRQDFTPY